MYSESYFNVIINIKMKCIYFDISIYRKNLSKYIIIIFNNCIYIYVYIAIHIHIHILSYSYDLVNIITVNIIINSIDI